MDLFITIAIIASVSFLFGIGGYIGERFFEE